MSQYLLEADNLVKHFPIGRGGGFDAECGRWSRQWTGFRSS